MDGLEIWGEGGITGVFRVPGKKDNGRRVVEFCGEKGLCVNNAYFGHKGLHKYTRVARGPDGMKATNMIYRVFIKKDMLHYVQDMTAVRGMGQDRSDHHVILCKVKVRLMGSWINRRKVAGRGRRIGSEKLREHPYRERYARFLDRKRVESNVKHVWEQVKQSMVKSAREACGLVREGGKNLKSM